MFHLVIIFCVLLQHVYSCIFSFTFWNSVSLVCRNSCFEIHIPWTSLFQLDTAPAHFSFCIAWTIKIFPSVCVTKNWGREISLFLYMYCFLLVNLGYLLKETDESEYLPLPAYVLFSFGEYVIFSFGCFLQLLLEFTSKALITANKRKFCKRVIILHVENYWTY